MHKVVWIDGLDKVGKDLVFKYAKRMDFNNTYVVRSPLSKVCYDIIFRNCQYNTEELNKHIDSIKNTGVLVLLDSDEKDLLIRFKLTNEDPIDIKYHKEIFAKVSKYFEEQGVTIIRYNSSEITPFNIAKDIIKQVKENSKD